MGWFRKSEPEPKDSFESQPEITQDENHAIFQGCDHPLAEPGDRFCGLCGHEFRIYQADSDKYPPIWR
jgi:hypothetical protein